LLTRLEEGIHSWAALRLRAGVRLRRDLRLVAEEIRQVIGKDDFSGRDGKARLDRA
jgi:hypothetical protein